MVTWTLAGERVEPDDDWQTAYAEDSAARADGRWATALFVVGDVWVWVLTVDPALDAAAADRAIAEIIEWTGVRVDGFSSGDGYEDMVGDPYGTMDIGLYGNLIRVYKRHGVVAFAVAETTSAIEGALATFQISAAPPPRKRGRAPETIHDLAAHFSTAAVPDVAAELGPNFRVLYALAAAKATGDLRIEFRLHKESTESEGSLWTFGGPRELGWMFMAHGNPPGDTDLANIRVEIATESSDGWAVVPGSVEVRAKRAPTFDTAEAARIAEAALVEAFAWRPPPPPPKRARKGRGPAA